MTVGWSKLGKIFYKKKFQNICKYWKMSYICLTMKDTKQESITFRTTKELKDALQMIADKEKRTVSSMIEILLETAVKTFKKK